MSLAIKYESAEDAKMRLRHTVVLYKGTPVFILDVKPGEGKPDDILRVLFQELPYSPVAVRPFGERIERVAIPQPAPPDGAPVKLNEDVQRKYISSKHFDIAPFRLGYVNSSQPSVGTFYCNRLPNRVQKQGLCGENFQGRTVTGAPITFNTFLACKEAVATVEGRYPTFDQALSFLSERSSVAFDRDFCLVKDEVIPDLIYLHHKGVKVGMYSKNEIKLGTKFKCLKERLNEMKLTVGGFR